MRPEQDPVSPLESQSPLLTASLALLSGKPFLYPVPESDGRLVSEEKERGRWGRGQAETEAERAARLEARQVKTEEIHRRVEAGLEALALCLSQGRSGEFIAFLESLSRFHRYSWANTILIAFQNPEATLVAGFNAWKELGRYVKPAEKGIAILAPLKRRTQRGEEEKSESEGTQTPAKTAPLAPGVGSVYGFKVVHVFDVSQTDGKPLPELACVKGDPAHYLARLKDAVRAEGVTLSYRESPGGALGSSSGGRIEIKSGLSPAQEFSTLVHELAHELLHPVPVRGDLSPATRETEAEAAAYVVSRSIGLDPGTSSSDYIQLYLGDTSTLSGSLERIQQTASRILSCLEGPEGSLFRKGV